MDAPRNVLPSRALERLCSSKFMLGTPAERMDAIVEAVLVKHCTTFNIGHKVALFVRNYFINQDGTLTSFIRALKVHHALFGFLLFVPSFYDLAYSDVDYDFVFYTYYIFQLACLLHFSMEPLSLIHGRTLAEDQTVCLKLFRSSVFSIRFTDYCFFNFYFYQM